jgi:hypothetical protein
MAEDSADAPEKPNLATNAGQPDEGQIASKKLPYWLFLIPLVIMILQSALGFISVKTGILSSEIVQQTGFLVFMVIGAPILAIMGWQYLISDSGLRYHWEARLLAASTIVVIAGFDTFAIMDLANTALLRTAFSDVMLFATVISLALLICSALVMLIRVGLSAIANRRQARIDDRV